MQSPLYLNYLFKQIGIYLCLNCFSIKQNYRKLEIIYFNYIQLYSKYYTRLKYHIITSDQSFKYTSNEYTRDYTISIYTSLSCIPCSWSQQILIIKYIQESYIARSKICRMYLHMHIYVYICILQESLSNETEISNISSQYILCRRYLLNFVFVFRRKFVEF